MNGPLVFKRLKAFNVAMQKCCLFVNFTPYSSWNHQITAISLLMPLFVFQNKPTKPIPANIPTASIRKNNLCIISTQKNIIYEFTSRNCHVVRKKLHFATCLANNNEFYFLCELINNIFCAFYYFFGCTFYLTCQTFYCYGECKIAWNSSSLFFSDGSGCIFVQFFHFFPKLKMLQ